jgi:hypothetical protein
MNSYITLGSCKYKTLGSDWVPSAVVPSQIKVTWTGRLDVIYGPSSIKSVAGTVIVRNTPETGYGCIDDFRLIYEGNASFTFIDHYGVTHTAVITGQVNEKSLTNMWDASANEYRIPVQLYIVG